MQLHMALSMHLALLSILSTIGMPFKAHLCPHGASLPNPGVTDYEGLPFSCLSPWTREGRDKSVSCDTVLGSPATLQALSRHL